MIDYTRRAGETNMEKEYKTLSDDNIKKKKLLALHRIRRSTDKMIYIDLRKDAYQRSIIICILMASIIALATVICCAYC